MNRLGGCRVVTQLAEASLRHERYLNSLSVGCQDQRSGDPVNVVALRQCEADLCSGNLPGSALAPQLADDLDRHHSGGIPDVTARQQATVGVARHGPAEAGVPFPDVVGCLAKLAEAKLFEITEECDRKAVVEVRHVDVVASDPSLSKGVVTGASNRG